MQGGVGWQGIIPSRAAKMGSIAVDKGIAKLGSPADFYRRLDPERIAEHILDTAREDIRQVVERIMEREYPDTWRGLPRRVRNAVHARVEQQLPDIVRTVTDEIGDHIDQLLDIKLMVIRRIEENPEMANRIYLEVGRRAPLHHQLRILLRSRPGNPAGVHHRGVPHWWVLPIGGVIIGYVATGWRSG